METDSTTVDINASHPSVTERYYTPKYKIDVVRKGEDHCVLLHSNRICVVTLAESHPILAEGKHVTKVDYQIDKKTDRLKNKVSGKGKRGAQWLQDESPLCRVTCSDESQYMIRSCINASLIEVNERLITRPELMHQKPSSAGYVALILTGLKEHQRVIDKLLTKEQYQKAMEERKAGGEQNSETGNGMAAEGSKKNSQSEKGMAPEGGKKNSADKLDSEMSKMEEGGGKNSVVTLDSETSKMEEGGGENSKEKDTQIIEENTKVDTNNDQKETEASGKRCLDSQTTETIEKKIKLSQE